MFVRMNKMMNLLPRCFALLGVLLVFCAPTAAQPIALTEPAEIALAKHLMNLGFTLQAAADTLEELPRVPMMTVHAAKGSMAVNTPAWLAGTRCKPVIHNQTVPTLAARA